MKNKKILKLLLSLITIPFITGCSLFEKNGENNENKIIISNASFTSTYSTITFNFERNENAIYYTAYFRGEENAALSRIEPKVTYNLPELADGTYSVFLKAFANINYEDSDLFDLGKMTKEKNKLSNETINLSAELTDSYAIIATIKNTNENDINPITARIYKDGALLKEERNIIGQKIFSTEEELPAGEYTISAFFQDTNDSLASDEKFLSQPLNVQKRKLEIKSFKAIYDEGKISLSWETQKDISCKKTLTISQNGHSNSYTNSFNEIAIKSGMIIDASTFELGEITFKLTLIPSNQDTYLTSEEYSVSTVISNFKENAPNISVNYSEEGDVIISKNDNKNGSYKVKIVPFGEPLDNNTKVSFFTYEETVSSFPIVFKKANETWRHSNYHITVSKLSSSPYGEDSVDAIEEIKIDNIQLKPNLTVVKEKIDGDDGFNLFIKANSPKWLSLSWINDYVYHIDVSGLGDCIYTHDLTASDNQVTLPFQFSNLATSNYLVSAYTYYDTVPYGYASMGFIDLEEFNVTNDKPIDDYMIANLEASDPFSSSGRAGIEVSPKIEIYVDKIFAYTSVSGTLYYRKNTTNQEESIDFTFGEEIWVTGKLATELRLTDFQSRSNGGYIYIVVEAWLGDSYTQLEWSLGPLHPIVY